MKFLITITTMFLFSFGALANSGHNLKFSETECAVLLSIGGIHKTSYIQSIETMKHDDVINSLLDKAHKVASVYQAFCKD